MKNQVSPHRPFQLTVIRLQSTAPKIATNLEIFFLLQGSGNFRMEQQTQEIKAGTCIFIAESTEYAFAGENQCTFVHFSLQTRQFVSAFPDIKLYNFMSFLTSTRQEDSSEIARCVQEFLHFVVHYYQESQTTVVYSAFFQFLGFFEQVIQNTEWAPKFNIQSGQDERITKMLHLIHQQYQQDLNLHEIAEQLHVSYTYLSKLFKEEVGHSFLKYLNNVRLNGVEQDLRNTSDSVYSVGINNGFSSLKTMNKLFKSRHHQTPTEYRKAHEILENQVVEAPIVLDDQAIIENLSKFIVSTDKVYNPDQSKTEKICIPTGQFKNEFRQPYRIAKIAKAEDGLLNEIQEQLVILKKELHFSYVQFEGFCDPTPFGNTLYFMDSYHKNNQWFDFLYETELAPFIQLGDFAYSQAASIEEWCDQVVAIIQSLMSRYELSYFSKWKIGWFPLYTPADTEIFLTLYRKIKHICPLIQFGFLSLTSLNQEESRMFESFATELAGQGVIPNFISMMADPYSGKISVAQRLRTASHYMNYQELIIQKINNSLKKIDLTKAYEQTELILTDWNTLAGEGETYTGSFFRAALITNAMIKMSSQLDGITFWLNAKVLLRFAERREDSSLSIFLYNRIKRPVFFVLSFLDCMKGFITWEAESYILTKKNTESFLMVYNPSLLNPRDSVDRFSVDETARKLNIEIQNLEPGNYIMKRYLLDKDHGGVYNQLLQISSLKDASKEWENYLEQKIIPLFTIDHIVVDKNPIVITSVLSLNAVELIQLRRISS